MEGFVDETTIVVSSGKGGDGALSFRREKFVPRGGPDGGDGGRGGDVVFVVQANLRTLAHLKLRRAFVAQDGARGGGGRRHGRDGKSVVIPVPPGTLLYCSETGEVLLDLVRDGERRVFLRGGRGGKGNWHFRTPVNRAPRYAEPGAPGAERRIRVELHMIADAGLVGKPNAGKSTLLAALTRARPKIADYPFTTRAPHLGLLRLGERDLVLADLPGIIEGASRGLGLGLRFLRHIERCPLLLYLVDLGAGDGPATVRLLARELARYSTELASRPRILVGTKLDREGARGRLGELHAAFPGDRVVGVCALTREGLSELVEELSGLKGKAA